MRKIPRQGGVSFQTKLCYNRESVAVLEIQIFGFLGGLGVLVAKLQLKVDLGETLLDLSEDLRDSVRERVRYVVLSEIDEQVRANLRDSPEIQGFVKHLALTYAELALKSMKEDPLEAK